MILSSMSKKTENTTHGRGRLIVLYGINNIGKTTQAKLLVQYLQKCGIPAEYLKYPIYHMSPTGPEINALLRGGKKFHITEEAFQALYAKNRRDYQPHLIEKLKKGIFIVAEDYIGTGIAWGITKGVDRKILEKQNRQLISEDIAILLDGEQFSSGREPKHLHESDSKLIQTCREIHRQLAKRYHWSLVNANQSIHQVHRDILKIIKQSLFSDSVFRKVKTPH